jgi:NAD(P)-dependent dehydrogenase (short-subunit alcohol dehydrogenase family)
MNTTIPPLPTAQEFANKVAVVTGGTNGLGRHLCQSLIQLGSEVFFCGRRSDLGARLSGEWGRAAHFVQCDLANPAEAEAFVRQAGDRRGHIDYLVSNAAIDPVIEFSKATLDEFDRTVAIDLRSYFLVSQSALPYLQKGTGKAVVNIATTNYMFGFAGATVYNAAKSGIIGFSRSLARELGPLGIRVNVVSPGWIMTERQLAQKVTDQDKLDLIHAQCVKELMTESHVTPATLFLLSQAARGITGQNLVVDGGKFMQ